MGGGVGRFKQSYAYKVLLGYYYVSIYILPPAHESYYLGKESSEVCGGE